MSADPEKVIRNPENYEDMLKKLREREEEEQERVKKKLENPEADLDSEEAIAMARKEMNQRSNRRDFKSLSADEKETKIDPADPQVLALKDKVAELSRTINSQLSQSTDPQVKRALLKGRVKPGNIDKGAAAGG